MTGGPPKAPRDPALLAQARAHPGGWAYEIDRPYPDDQRTPPEAVRGAWRVDDSGRITSEFQPNARYRPVERPRRELKAYMHAAARTNRSQWISEIDPRGEDKFPDIPPELIRGWWYVDGQGRLTGEFRPSSHWIGEADAGGG